MKKFNQQEEKKILVNFVQKEDSKYKLNIKTISTMTILKKANTHAHKHNQAILNMKTQIELIIPAPNV